MTNLTRKLSSKHFVLLWVGSSCHFWKQIVKIFQILAMMSDHPPVSQTIIFLYAKKSAFYLIFKSHVSHTLSCLCTHCQRNQLSSEKLSWRVEDRLVPVPGASLFEVKATPMLHWWTFRKASSNLGAFVTLHSGWNFPAEAKDDYYPHFIVQRLNNLSLRFKVFYSIWQRWVYIFI